MIRTYYFLKKNDMCGIAGFTGNNRDLIEKMTAALVHRGPDGNAVIVTDNACLGHARLAILDPSPEGNQPMWNEQKTLVIVYNGEIFNYRELRKQYGLHCKTGTDTEVILQLFEREGVNCISQLRGMFAFGIYETKTQTWYLARDPSGIKPLFISYPQGRLHFASEMRSLMLACPEKPALNMSALSLYLQLQYVPGPQTLCEGIESLPPGTILTWSKERETRQSFKTHTMHSIYQSKEDFRTNFPLLMSTVVRDHMISDKPIGMFLSGGMDSSIILHHMTEHRSKNLRTFTVKFDATKEEDEARFNRDAVLAAMTAKHYGTNHTEIALTADLCREVYADCAKAMDQPNADSVAMAQFVMAKKAKETVDVVLCGAGGDELFGGYPRYRIAHILQKFRYVPKEVRGAVGAMLGYPPDVLRMDPDAILMQRLLARPTQEMTDIVQGDWFDASATPRFFAEQWKQLTPQNDPLRKCMEFDRHTWLVDESLRLNDAMTMASGLECRVPFLDPRIIAASHATTSEWHVSMRRTKCLLKDTYRSIVPPHLFTLNKASFYPPLAKWLRRECAPLVEEMLEHEAMKTLFNIQKIQTIFDEHRTKKKYALHALSTLIQLSNWFKTVYTPS